MIALALAVSMAAAAPQQTPLTQAEYHAFKRCQGEMFGFYRTGVIIFGGTQMEPHVHQGAGKMNDFLLEVDAALVRTGIRLDWQAGYAVYQSGIQRWDGWHNRRGAEDQYFDSNPMNDHCDAAVDRVANFIDAN